MSKINKIKINDISYDIQDLSNGASIGDLENLETEDKTNIVNAINEVLNNNSGVIQSDWAQNDDTQSDYIKNRIGGYVVGEPDLVIIPYPSEKTFTFGTIEGVEYEFTDEEKAILSNAKLGDIYEICINGFTATAEIIKESNASTGEAYFYLYCDLVSEGYLKVQININSIFIEGFDLENDPLNIGLKVISSEGQTIVKINEEYLDLGNYYTKEEIGLLENLLTEDKSNVVNAINEIFNNSGGIEEITGNTDMTTLPYGIYRITAELRASLSVGATKGLLSSVFVENDFVFWDGVKTVIALGSSGGSPRIKIYYVDSASIGREKDVSISNIVDLTTVQTIVGKKTFTTLPETSVTPTTSNQLVNKSYVDTAITNAIGTALGGEY